MKLDKKDFQILGILDWNARTPINRIAKQSRLNKDVARYRIKNLEKEGVIEGYYSVINTSKLGYITIRIYFDLVNTSIEIENKIINYLDKKFNACQIFTIDGEYSLGIIAWEKSIYELDRRLKKFREQFGNYVNKEIMSIFSSFSQYPRKIFQIINKDIIIIKEEDKFNVKENDLKILKELSKNARMTSIDLSLKLKIPQTTIINRIKELEKQKIILGHRAKINIKKLGYENYFLEIYTYDGKQIKEIEEFAQFNRNCIYSETVFPGADIEIETEFQNKAELLKFIENLKNKYKSIKKIKYWSTLEYKKFIYVPED